MYAGQEEQLELDMEQQISSIFFFFFNFYYYFILLYNAVLVLPYILNQESSMSSLYIVTLII